ncbi:MAG: PorT family protein [Cyclobacteriaceae bacterium]|nr:PorT family protein [Cyclobacteriaceae bacterium]
MKTIDKKIILLLALLVGLSTQNLMAQSSLTIDASQVFSTFSFNDTQSPKNINLFGTADYNTTISGAYSLGYRLDKESGLIARGSLGMRRSGASTIIDQTNYQWDFQYIELKAGAGYKISPTDKLGIYMTLSPYLGYLLTANQRLDNEDFDIKKSGDIKKMDLGLHTAPGVIFNVNEFVSLFGEFDYMVGLKNLETATTDQKSYNIAYAMTLGLAFTIQ